MEKFDWTSTIKMNFYILRGVGMWPKERYGLNFYTFYALFVAVVIIGGQNLSQIINLFFVYKDLASLVATLFILITNVLAIIKMCSFARNQKAIKRLIDSLNDARFLPKSLSQLELIQPSLHRWTRCYRFFSAIVGANLTLWTVAPLFSEEKILPFFAWYPFRADETPAYEIVYTYQALCIWGITAANLTMDTMTYALFMYIWSQCDILCDDLSNLRGSASRFKTELLKCIDHHKEIVRFAEESNRLLDVIILGQFATSTIALASSMFHLKESDFHSLAALTTLNYLAGMLTQLFLYCWFGDEVESRSSQFLYSIFKSQWFEQSLENQKSLLILSMRCQRPIKIITINLFSVKLGTFVIILRSAWSYFALLCQVDI